jgi:hypothetical protein
MKSKPANTAVNSSTFSIFVQFVKGDDTSGANTNSTKNSSMDTPVNT